MRETSIIANRMADFKPKHHSVILDTMKRVGKPIIAERIAYLSGLNDNQVSRRMS